MSIALISSSTEYELRAAFNPTEIIFERRDHASTSVSAHAGWALLNTGGVDLGLTFGEPVYIIVALGYDYSGWHTVRDCTTSGVEIDVAYAGNASGWICSNELYQNSRAVIRFNDAGGNPVAEMVYTIGSNMRAIADLSGIAAHALGKDNDFLYEGESEVAASDTNLCTKYSFAFKEVYDGSGDVSPEPTWGASYNVLFINTAVQILNDPDLRRFELGVAGGGYFLTEFETLTVFNGYPKSLTFIWRGDTVNPQDYHVYRSQQFIGYLIGHYDTDEFGRGATQVHGGAVRVAIKDSASNESSGKIGIRVTDEASPPVEQDGINYIPVIYSHDACRNVPIYLCWLNKLGGFSYWLFHTSQELSHIVSSKENITHPLGDTVNTRTIEDTILVEARDVITIGASNIREDQLEGIKSLLHSVRVMMLTNPDEYDSIPSPVVAPIWKTVQLKRGTFKLGLKQHESYSVEVAIEMPRINIQRL